MRELLPIIKDFQSSSAILALPNPLVALVANGLLVPFITVQRRINNEVE